VGVQGRVRSSALQGYIEVEVQGWQTRSEKNIGKARLEVHSRSNQLSASGKDNISFKEMYHLVMNFFQLLIDISKQDQIYSDREY
jgi:hypothetical protein